MADGTLALIRSIRKLPTVIIFVAGGAERKILTLVACPVGAFVTFITGDGMMFS